MHREIEVTIVEYQKHKLSEKQQIEIARGIIAEAGNLPDNFYIKNGNITEEIEHSTSHTWYTEKILRKATKLDKATVMVLNSLLQYKKDLGD